MKAPDVVNPAVLAFVVESRADLGKAARAPVEGSPSMMAMSLPPARTMLWAVGVLGFSLGGFFDGILLHQVLQWHHFLSLVPGEAWQDLRNQVLADGWFHVAVYAITCVGLVLLWRGRGGIGAAGLDRKMLASFFLGFAIWQAADVVGFHWLLGIHRIRVGVPNPLAYDVGWLLITGLPPLVLAWLISRSARSGPEGGGHGKTYAIIMAALTLGSGLFAGLPPTGDLNRVAVFRSGIGSAGALSAIAGIDGRVLWMSASGELVAFRASSTVTSLGLFRFGALFVGSSSIGAGCLETSFQ